MRVLDKSAGSRGGIDRLVADGFELCNKERSLLTALHEKSPNLLTTEELIDAGWGSHSADYRLFQSECANLRTSMSHLMEKIVPNRLVNISVTGYFLIEETPECAKRLEALKGTKLHLAESAASLAQILMLNDIFVGKKGVTMLYLVLQREGAITLEEVSMGVYGDTCFRVESLWTHMSLVNTAVSGREINGCYYRIKNQRASGVECRGKGAYYIDCKEAKAPAAAVS